MAEYIDREAAISLIEEKQKALCPSGRYGRHYVYRSDREAYDAWEEIIDSLESISTADVAQVVHGRWKYYHKKGIATCTVCSFERKLDDDFGQAICCPNCGALMDKEEK